MPTRHHRLLITAVLALCLALPTPPSEAAPPIVTYYHLDALGSPLAATDAQGNLVWTETYSAYGDTLQNPPAATPTPRGYTGHPYDRDIGLSYFGARWYDASIGRFMGMDPKAPSEGELHSFNRYNYANNNPYKYVDPDGQEVLPSLLIFIPVAIAGTYIFANPAQRAQMDRVAVRVWEGMRSESSNEGGAKSGTGNGEDASSGDKHPSTPTGQRGSPLEVEPGTNEPANIGGRDYTGHALDQMQGRGVPPSAVEDAVQNGIASPGNKPSRIVHTSPDGRVSVVTEGGKIITVMPK